MAENIEDIAKSIKRHRDLELSTDIQDNATAVGRSMTLYDKQELQFWLINKEPQRRQSYDFIGNIIPDSIWIDNKPLEGDGKTVHKNSPLGGILIMNHEGTHKHKTPKGDIEIEILNRATYKPSKTDGEFATEISIRLLGDGKSYSYQNIAKIIHLQEEINEAKEQLEKATGEEATLLVQRITDKEREKKSYLDKAQSFIRRQTELRYQPILDPLQEAIKRSKIFNGTLIINGGPGTGKTTSLIQRIRFLISPTIQEFKQLTQSQISLLSNEQESWIFYSPNELLALFLRNSMTKEELIADRERVKVWSNHKGDLVKSYRIVDTTTKRPFLFYNKSHGVSLFVSKAKEILKITAALESSYMNFQKEKLNKVSEIDVSPFKWKNLGQSIQKYITGRSNAKSIEELIRLFLNLTDNFKNETDDIAAEYKSLVEKIASSIQVTIQKDTERATALSVLLKQWKTDTNEVYGDEDEEADIEQEDFDEKVEQAFDFEKELFTKLKSLCRKQALKKFDKNTKFSKRDRELLTLIPEVTEEGENDFLGQTAFFKKFFERITKGVVANILREIPMIYKRHRREQLNSKATNWNLTVLEELVKKDKNSRIHPEEQALLLSFVNSIVLKLAKSFQKQYNDINHPYINGFKNHCKPVIGIDEATDFSIIDLIAINSFGHPELSSVTLSGDLMQRMTSDGLTSWQNFTEVIPNSEIKDLKVSYRQSPTLLSLAKAIYQKSTGKTANYESYIEKDETEPKPLMFVSKNEDDKLQWIADRILEIYKAYGESIPSIAIFLPDENQLENFANKLGGLDALADVGIPVMACRKGQVLGDKTAVRVFSIDVIKGLEFEAVFFHNIDDLQNKNLTNDLFLKYLYVGLSRATFYLGLTLSNELSKDISFIADSFDKNGKTWEL